MQTLFHAPRTRSTRVVALLKELGALDAVRITVVSTARMDGTGGRDPANPHPEGKVPVLAEDGVLVRESAAIVLHLADLFPAAGLNVPAGDPRRGAYLAWFAWYAGVLEPAIALEASGVSHPVLDYTFRTAAEARARVAEALADRPYLMGERFTAADLLVPSAFAWFGPTGDPTIDAWVARCSDRDGARYATAFDAEHAPIG